MPSPPRPHAPARRSTRQTPKEARPAWFRDAIIGVSLGLFGALLFGAYRCSLPSPARSPARSSATAVPAVAAAPVSTPMPQPQPSVPAPVQAPVAPPPAQGVVHTPPQIVQPPPGQPARIFVPMAAEYVDCGAKAAPSWCRTISYATASERAGTIVAILRPPVPGSVYFCAGGRHISSAEDDGRVPASVLKKLGAWSVTLEPRHASRSEYYVIPDGSGLVEPEWMTRCPVGAGPPPP
jgi:hypothetical protein